MLKNLHGLSGSHQKACTSKAFDILVWFISLHMFQVQVLHPCKAWDGVLVSKSVTQFLSIMGEETLLVNWLSKSNKAMDPFRKNFEHKTEK